MIIIGTGAGRAPWPTPGAVRGVDPAAGARGLHAPGDGQRNPKPVFVTGRYISKDTWFDRDGKPFHWRTGDHGPPLGATSLCKQVGGVSLAKSPSDSDGLQAAQWWLSLKPDGRRRSRGESSTVTDLPSLVMRIPFLCPFQPVTAAEARPRSPLPPARHTGISSAELATSSRSGTVPSLPARYQGGVSDFNALAEARRIVPAPLIKARRHGATPSISVSSEKLRNVLITTISPSTRTLSRVGETTTVRTRSAATSTSSPNSRVPPNACLSTR